MLTRQGDLVAGSCGSVVRLNDLLEASFTNHTPGKPIFENIKKVVIINEGAGDAVGLLGKGESVLWRLCFMFVYFTW